MAETAAPPGVRELIPRLPRTFGPALNDQFRQWDLLFPAEQRGLEAQLDYLRRLPPEQFKRLFAPLVAIEGRMDLPHWDASSTGLSINDTGILARSPLYPQWRSEVEKVFSQIDEGAGKRKQFPRLLVCVLPAGLPVGSQPMWPELAKSGKWIGLDQPFGAVLPGLAAAVAKRKLPADLEPVEGTWVFECEPKLASLAESSPATVLTWSSLAAVRREFMSRLNSIKRTLNSVDQTNEELRRMDLGPLLGADLASKPRIREFLRTLLLSGNGSLIFGNSFVQWGAAEALRRAEPGALFACFCIRPKLKPFSSSVLFEDQSRSNPVADEDDPAGSLVDAIMLADYVHLAAQRLAPYEGRTLTILSAWDLNRILVLSPEPVPEMLSSEALVTLMLDWLG
jgi:hypothetical protein